MASKTKKPTATEKIFFFIPEARAGIEPARGGFADRSVSTSPSGRDLILPLLGFDVKYDRLNLGLI